MQLYLARNRQAVQCSLFCTLCRYWGSVFDVPGFEKTKIGVGSAKYRVPN
jgi:hypothetical protein